MPELTPKLGIKKALGNETVSRAAFNENWDIIDANVQKNIIQSNTAPASPVLGDLWIDTSTTPNSLKKYNGTGWGIIGAVTPEQIGAVKNAGNVPSIQSGLDASKPAAGTAGRLYIATDTFKIYRDNGTSWDIIGTVNWGDITGKPSSFTPSAHKSTHAIGGADALTPADIGAVNILSASKIINVPADYPTIQAALDSLKNVWIPKDVTVTIQVAAGMYNITSPIVIDHPCGSKIQIIGATPATTSITGVGSISGQAGNYSIQIKVLSTSGITSGNYVIINNTTGSGDYHAFDGICKVISVDSSTQITVQNTHRASSFPSASLSGGTVVILNTIINATGCHGILITPNSAIGLIDNIGLIGNGTPSTAGLWVGVTADLSQRGSAIAICGSKFGISGFSTGISVTNSSTLSTSCIFVCGNSGVGIYLSRGSSANVNNCISNGNGANGFQADLGSNIQATSSIAKGNGQYGFEASVSSNIYALSSIASGNVNADYYVTCESSIFASGYSGSPTFSPAVNTVGNSNSIIVA
jgi:hypothetical protein